MIWFGIITLITATNAKTPITTAAATITTAAATITPTGGGVDCGIGGVGVKVAAMVVAAVVSSIRVNKYYSDFYSSVIVIYHWNCQLNPY